MIFSIKCNVKLTLNNRSKTSPKKQKQAPVKPLSYYFERYANRHEGMAQAYLSGHYTLTEVGHHYNVSYATVSRAVKAVEQK